MKAVIKKYRRLWLVLFFLIFLGVIDYPFLSRLYNDRVQGNTVIFCTQTMENLERQEREMRIQKARVYNRKLAEGGVTVLEDTFLKKVAGDGTVKEATALLGTGEDTIGIVEIPKIQVNLPIYGDTSKANLQRGAGLLEGSSLPIGGKSTHTCISAHRGLPGKTMFTSLDLLEEGDLFYLTVLGEKLAYRVTGIQTVKPDEVENLAIKPGQDLATLITCTPYGINTHRLYVHGERTEFPQGEEASQTAIPPESFWRTWGWIPLNIVLLLWLVVLLVLTGRRKNKK